MATAALGHGTASSGDDTASQPNRVTLRATEACLDPSARRRRDGKDARRAGRVERQLRRGPAMAAVGENGEYALTEAQSTRLNGGGDGGEHGEALGERSNTFLQR